MSKGLATVGTQQMAPAEAHTLNMQRAASPLHSRVLLAPRAWCRARWVKETWRGQEVSVELQRNMREMSRI